MRAAMRDTKQVSMHRDELGGVEGDAAGLGGQQCALSMGWQLGRAAPGQFAGPADLGESMQWVDAPVLGPVADVLRQLGQWSLDGEPCRFDAQDWWYRLRFDLPQAQAWQTPTLCLGGLATLAEVWLNSQPVLRSDNMFVAHRVPLGGMLRAKGNELVMVFRSLDHALAQRRPRPRWKAPMIEQQQLRWFRTTVLGRTPGWSPPAAVVGPWRPVWLESGDVLQLDDVALQASVTDGAGQLLLQCRFGGVGDGAVPQVQAARLRLRHGEASHVAELLPAPQQDQAGGGVWQAALHIDQPELWWPHTHGKPALYEAHLEVSVPGHARPVVRRLGHVGFRRVEVEQADGGFAVRVNGVTVFCRGACWTPLDPVTLDASSPDHYMRAVAQAREAGMNMIRVGGTMSYEADAFYDECDRQGVLVWQEFMFANMDYPQDAAFVASVKLEATQQLQRWQARPCMAVLCGNSEVEQQAAMFGATRDKWSPELFHVTLAALCRQLMPDVPYWPSSAHGGAMPYQGDVGTTSYYGVGAYLRRPDDARRAQLRFATECLAFANVPEWPAIAAMPGGLSLRVHHPAWKARAPRDLGAGWDFEDVRDHYLAQLFEVDPTRLRYSDHDRYLALGRVATGEVMAAAFGEWRRQASTCRGALVWFMRDLWPGAGWGVVDSLGQPKAAYYYLKRALQPLAMTLSDEGGNGLYVHVSNDRAQALNATLEVTAWRHGEVQVAQGRQLVTVPAHAAGTWPLMNWFDWFADWSWAYRFGPAPAQLVSAVLRSDAGEVLARAHAFPAGMGLALELDLGLHAQACVLRQLEGGEDEVRVRISTRRFAQCVHVQADGYAADDAYFHLSPGEVRDVVLRAVKTAKPMPFSGQVLAINMVAAINIVVESAPL
jgi:beta-mannosidase